MSLYFLNTKPLVGLFVVVLDDDFNIAKLRHCRLGRIGMKGLKALKNKGVFEKSNIREFSNCE